MLTVSICTDSATDPFVHHLGSRPMHVIKLDPSSEQSAFNRSTVNSKFLTKSIHFPNKNIKYVKFIAKESRYLNSVKSAYARKLKKRMKFFVIFLYSENVIY